MKYLILASLLSAIAILNIGFYNEVSDGEVNKVFFIKKHLTFRVQFTNIHANDGNHRKVEN